MTTVNEIDEGAGGSDRETSIGVGNASWLPINGLCYIRTRRIVRANPRRRGLEDGREVYGLKRMLSTPVLRHSTRSGRAGELFHHVPCDRRVARIRGLGQRTGHSVKAHDQDRVVVLQRKGDVV